MKENNHYKNVGVVLLVLLSIAFLYKSPYLFWGTVAFGILLFSFEKLAILFSKYWMKFGKLLGDINSRIILSIFFLLILTPLALIKKIVTRKKVSLNSSWEQAQEQLNFTKPW